MVDRYLRVIRGIKEMVEIIDSKGVWGTIYEDIERRAREDREELEKEVKSYIEASKNTFEVEDIKRITVTKEQIKIKYKGRKWERKIEAKGNIEVKIIMAWCVIKGKEYQEGIRELINHKKENIHTELLKAKEKEEKIKEELGKREVKELEAKGIKKI